MAKVLVLYYSSFGHVEKLAHEIASGASEAGATVDVKRVPELLSAEAARSAGYKVEQRAPVAKVEDLANYDAIVIGTGTRFGRMSSQMASFLDQAGGLWAKGALQGKVGAAFASSATQHGGQMNVDEITGGAPYGVTTVAGPDGKREVSENELAGARHQGRTIAEVAAKLHG